MLLAPLVISTLSKFSFSRSTPSFLVLHANSRHASSSKLPGVRTNVNSWTHKFPLLQCFAEDREFPALLFIGSTPRNDVTSLTTYTTHTRVSDTRKNIYIYIYIYNSNPWESNHRDGPTGHKNE